MTRRKNIFRDSGILAIVLIVLALSTTYRYARAQDGTIPTMTPKPGPTAKPTDDSGGGGNPEPTKKPNPTDEPGSGPTPTEMVVTTAPTSIPPSETPSAVATASAIPATPTATPFIVVPSDTETPAPTETTEIIVPGEEIVAFPAANRPFPQASQCGMPPTFTSGEAISVYEGPGTDYALVGLIGEAEVRPIVGRAAFGSWWMVQLDSSGRTGWVDDDAGIIHGYTGLVPLVPAPELNGITPTPGSNIWAPTPSAECNASELLVGAAANEVQSGEIDPPSNKPNDKTKVDNEESPIQATAEAEENSGTDGPDVVLASQKETAASLVNDLADTAPPLELPDDASSQLPNLMPVVGVVLILAAVVIGLFARKNQDVPGSADE